MSKYPITGLLVYCNLHLQKLSRSGRQAWSKQVVCVWGHADGVCASLKND